LGDSFLADKAVFLHCITPIEFQGHLKGTSKKKKKKERKKEKIYPEGMGTYGMAEQKKKYCTLINCETLVCKS
jgi:hypothetical protein